MKKLTVGELEKEYPDAYKFLFNHNINEISNLRYELNDTDYVNIESYQTQTFETRRYESHRKYIDIQYIISGEENIVTAPLDKLQIEEAYNTAKDIAFYRNNFYGTDNILKAGDMLLLGPDDGHMPCVAVGKPCGVRKAVFKIHINGDNQ